MCNISDVKQGNNKDILQCNSAASHALLAQMLQFVGSWIDNASAKVIYSFKGPLT